MNKHEKALAQWTLGMKQHKRREREFGRWEAELMRRLTRIERKLDALLARRVR